MKAIACAVLGLAGVWFVGCGDSDALLFTKGAGGNHAGAGAGGGQSVRAGAGGDSGSPDMTEGGSGALAGDLGMAGDGDAGEPGLPDACASAPCKNGGTCKTSASGSAVCTCAAGYSGADCATNIDDCAPNPCLHGGTCTDKVNDYGCACAPGYSGKACADDIDDCASLPCVNGGTCTDKVNDFSCTCPAGYDGKTCSNDVNDCATQPCVNGGTCTDEVNDFSCACAAGYDGKTCSHDIDDCAPNPCAHGTCTDKVHDFSCTCDSGYEFGSDGKVCDRNIDDCAPNPCLNGGTCADGLNAYTCTCATYYTGTTCATYTLPASCKAIKTATPSATDGMYTIDPDGTGAFAPLSVFCDMTTDGGGYTSYVIDNGISTSRFDQANSCTALGLNLVVARTAAHLAALFGKYGDGYFRTVPGVYGLAAGDYSDCAMNSSDPVCAANWKALGGGAWFAKATIDSEPNGDYIPGCWLEVEGPDDPVDGLGHFNDGGCDYETGTSYICSDNAK